MNFYHEQDPNLPQVHYRWHYVYLHGKAEQINGHKCYNEKWAGPEGAAAPDIFYCDSPMPTEPGEYKAKLYGHDVIAVLAKGRFHNELAGRVASVDDAEALNHARKPKDWR